MAAVAEGGPLVNSMSLGLGLGLGGRRDDLSDVAYEYDYEMVVRELIRECFTPMVTGAGYPGPGDLLAPLQDDYSIRVWLDGDDGTLKLQGRGLLFLPDEGGSHFIPREEIVCLEYRWHILFITPGLHASLFVDLKNLPNEYEFCCIHRDELPGLSNAIRERGWKIADLEEYKRKESPSVAAPAPATSAPRKKKRRSSVKKYRLRGAPPPPPPPAHAPPKRRRRLVKKYL